MPVNSLERMESIQSVSAVRGLTPELAQRLQTQDTPRFQPGDVFQATVKNIALGELTLALKNGELMSAKTDGLADLRIDEEAYFTVKSNDKSGQKLVLQHTGVPNLLKDALVNANLPPSPQNDAVINLLMRNILPLDSDTIHKALFFRFSCGLSEQETVQLLQENQQLTYQHLDYQVDERDFDAKLYMFKRSSGASSVLIMLDTLGLGRVEIFAQKESTNVSVKFASDNGGTLSLSKANVGRLRDMLGVVGYNLMSFDVREVDDVDGGIEEEQDAEVYEISSRAVDVRV
jgi:hypothetical protein